MIYNENDRVVIRKDCVDGMRSSCKKWLGRVMTVRMVFGKKYLMFEDQEAYDTFGWSEKMIDHDATAKLEIKKNEAETIRLKKSIFNMRKGIDGPMLNSDSSVRARYYHLCGHNANLYTKITFFGDESYKLFMVRTDNAVKFLADHSNAVSKYKNVYIEPKSEPLICDKLVLTYEKYCEIAKTDFCNKITEPNDTFLQAVRDVYGEKVYRNCFFEIKKGDMYRVVNLSECFYHEYLDPQEFKIAGEETV